MSFARSLSSALTRSLDSARISLASALRFEVSAPTAADDSRLLLYKFSSSADVKQMATGCDADIGGLSSMKIDLDTQEGKGRFWGTLSNEIPRNAKIQRSGYAGFRNKNRPTLFGSQTWDTTMHPYLCLRVKNRMASPTSRSSSPSSTSSPSLRSALSSSSSSGATVAQRNAIHALGLNLPATAGPKFYVNLQTDGPVTSDLFQHRLFLDESKGNEWQDVVIPLSDFVLLNSGQVSPSQIKMMREKIRTVGLSTMLEHPASVTYTAGKSAEIVEANSPPNALRSKGGVEDDFGSDGNLIGEDDRPSRETANVGVKRRGASYNFDLGIESISAISEEGLSEGD
ncbi:hypothetical protein CBS101457_001083 [Exobasidium rhododendri]|nr:hypothetical protein CBS101457_001083 [Exobasidium rhododendri]